MTGTSGLAQNEDGPSARACCACSKFYRNGTRDRLMKCDSAWQWSLNVICCVNACRLSQPTAAFNQSPRMGAVGDKEAEISFSILFSSYSLRFHSPWQIQHQRMRSRTLVNFPVAFKTWGRLSARADNALVVCHALTGTADVARWWNALLGPGRAFDTSRFFVICFNSLGSPYGSASPLTPRNGNPTNGPYGPNFPHSTIRDDVNIFRLVLHDLGVRAIAAVVGGSMGGMLALEFALADAIVVRSVVTIATAARFSAWGIAWGEVQRQAIFADAKFERGRYTHRRIRHPPAWPLHAWPPC
ncbi:Alpha/beta hydrolase fold-1 [Macrophomina phaseolina MS6]|uniref:Alpha/beta hydrolase fold-1 n=1 Tax=Macrophomina phaseolina (strain MS6) TaxID=1126212 RepID=K2RGB0_MACPH|nr:Alpha/beta hydrolase fold-1 [Macrophomina phaseolina MS6]